MLPISPDQIPDEFLTREIAVSASMGRRALALVALYGLGGILVLSAAQGGGGFRILMLAALGILAIYGGEKLRRATRATVILDAEGLRDTTGASIARWDEIEKIERGAFATKPSNGFSVVLKARTRAAWAPGLWWRLGRRVGIGGVLPGPGARFMGEQLALRLAARPSAPEDSAD